MPKGWEWTRFEYIIDIFQTGVDKGKQFQSIDNKYYYFKMNNITNDGRCSFDTFTKVDYEGDDIDRYIINNGDFLFNTRNSHELVGKTCVFQKNSNDIWLLNNNIVRVTFLNRILPEIVNLFFISSLGKRELEKLKSSTTNVAAIYQGQLLSFIIPLPPLAEQKRIVARIDELMALCDKLGSQIEQATAKQTALFNSILAKV